MNRPVFLVVSTALVAITIASLARSKPGDPGNDEAEIRNLEALRFRAMEKMDVAALEKLLSNDLVYTHATAWRQSKAEFIESIRKGEIRYHSITPEDAKVSFYGGTGVVTGKVLIKANSKGQELSVQLLYLEVFAKQDGRWQLVAWESTRLTS